MSEFRAWVDKLDHMTPEEIRDFLVDRQVRGARNKAYACPIARFLANELKESVGVDVFSIDTATDSAETSESVKAFIHHFDDGGWPELDVLGEIH